MAEARLNRGKIQVFSSFEGMGLQDRLEVTTRSDCYGRKVIAEIDGVQASLISLDDLKRNQQASGRLKDLADLESLP
jgi:hypothetical protein